jgi:hypothetical protein
MTRLPLNTNDRQQMFRALCSFNLEIVRSVLIVTNRENAVATYCFDSAAFAT